MNKQSIIVFIFMAIFTCCHQQDNSFQSLAGDWFIRLDPNDSGIEEELYNNSFNEKIILPGSLQEQGFGADVDLNTQWTGQVVDSAWYLKPQYERYRRPGNIKVPFWLNPEKHYVGVAWYQKEINIPSDWKGKNMVLELERTHWETKLYIDSKEIGKQDGLSTPHRYVFELDPGKHRLTLRVDNRVNIPVGINAHSVSDHTQSNWNGIVGEISLSTKPEIYIDDVQIYPDIKKKQAKVFVQLEGKVNTQQSDLCLQIETLQGDPVGQPVTIKINEAQLEATVDAGGEALLWSEHSPNLYRLKTTLISGKERDEQYTNFGFREFKKEGTRFQVNGQPVFLRGTLECCIFPLTGYPAMESEYWAKIYRSCKAFGLNHVRFHSWCPPEVAFNVADSMGIYLQVECAGWTTVGDGGYVDNWFYDEGDRILKEYGNHPSFCMMAYGNKPGGANQVQYLSDLVAYWKKKDNRRVYTSAGDGRILKMPIIGMHRIHGFRHGEVA